MKDRAYKIVRNGKYHEYQRALANVVYNVFDKKTGSGVSVNEKLENNSTWSNKLKIQKRKSLCKI